MRKSHTFSREQSTAIACVRHHQLQKSRIFKRHCRASTRKYNFSLKELKIHFTFATFSKFCPHYFGVNVTWEYLNLFLLIKHAFRPSKKKSSSNERQHWSDEYCILSIPKICFNCFDCSTLLVFLSLNSLFEHFFVACECRSASTKFLTPDRRKWIERCSEMIETSHRSYQAETSNSWENSNIQSTIHCSNLSHPSFFLQLAAVSHISRFSVMPSELWIMKVGEAACNSFLNCNTAKTRPKYPEAPIVRCEKVKLI